MVKTGLGPAVAWAQIEHKGAVKNNQGVPAMWNLLICWWAVKDSDLGPAD